MLLKLYLKKQLAIHVSNDGRGKIKNTFRTKCYNQICPREKFKHVE